MRNLAGWMGMVAIASGAVLATMAEVGAHESINSGSTADDTILAQVIWDTSDRTTAAMTITPAAIGPARLGMTLGELRQSSGGLTIGQPQTWISDFDALPVLDGGEVMFYVVYENWQPMSDGDRIQYLATDNPKVRTPEGIGPGSTLAEAAAVYGTPTLGYNVETHSREVLQFADLLWSDYSFEPITGGAGSFAGIYDTSQERSYQETNTYRSDAAIGSITIDTRGQ